MQVQLVCQFGQPTRGVSPYADALLAALKRNGDLGVLPTDFLAAYPSILHPAGQGGIPNHGELSWYNPASWLRVAKQPANIIHIQHWAPQLATYLLPMAALAKKYGKRVVVTVHNPVSHETAGPFTPIESAFLRSANLLIAHGNVASTMLRERMGASGPEVLSIPHGIELSAQPVVASMDDYSLLGLDPKHCHALLFGNLRGYKGIGVLLDAWEKVHHEIENARLIIAGRLWDGNRGPLASLTARLLGTASTGDDLRHRLSESNFARAVILRDGFMSDTDMETLIRISDIAVFPYVKFSGQSGAASLAASQGRPILVSQVGGLPDLAIDRSWVVEPNDSGQLSSSLIAKLENLPMLHDARARQIHAVKDFSWDIVAQAHISAYKQVAT